MNIKKYLIWNSGCKLNKIQEFNQNLGRTTRYKLKQPERNIKLFKIVKLQIQSS